MNTLKIWLCLLTVTLTICLSAVPNLAQACGGSGGNGGHHDMSNMGTMTGYGQGGNYYPVPPAPTPPNYGAPPGNPQPVYPQPDTGTGSKGMSHGTTSEHGGHTGTH